MQLHLLLTVFVGAAYAAATLTPADCDCVSSEYLHLVVPEGKALT